MKRREAGGNTGRPRNFEGELDLAQSAIRALGGIMTTKLSAKLSRFVTILGIALWSPAASGRSRKRLRSDQPAQSVRLTPRNITTPRPERRARPR